MKKGIILSDTGSERALLGTIIKKGKNAFIDADGIVCGSDMSLSINKAIYTSIQELSEDPDCQEFDLESIKLKMKSNGFGEHLNSPKVLEYIDLLSEGSFDTKNIQMFAYQIKKYSVVRDLYSRYTDAVNYLENISGNEPLSEIIRSAESKIVDYITGVEGNGNSLEKITDNLEQYVQQLLDSEVVDQIGLPTGFPKWDDAIGGGVRRGTIGIIGARSKLGKSWHAMNVSVNVARQGIPVLYLDTELNKEYQRSRMMCINTGCPLNLYETRQFKHDKKWVDIIKDSAKEMEQWPFRYESIAGMHHSEALALVRRWLVQHVGFNELGKANNCLVVYDYMKIMTGDSLSSFTPEHIVLGLMLTEMHNFAVKYDIPILGYVQLNRAGIESEQTDVIAGSDRILWLCSSMSILKNKDDQDLDLGCGWEYGNKKIVVLETRHGAGFERYGDYLNIHASLKPNISKLDACGSMREGFLFSEITNLNNGQK